MKDYNYGEPYHIRTEHEPQLYNEWSTTEVADKERIQNIVSRLKEEILYPDKRLVVNIRPWAVVPVVIELINDGSFTVEYIYDFIYNYWSGIEDGKDLSILAEYLYQCHDYVKSKILAEQLKYTSTDAEGYITIYRGYNSRNRQEGNSYTRDKRWAIWFSNRYGEEEIEIYDEDEDEYYYERYDENGYVNKYKIHIDNILAYILRRNESEIIAMPDDVILLEENVERK